MNDTSTQNSIEVKSRPAGPKDTGVLGEAQPRAIAAPVANPGTIPLGSGDSGAPSPENNYLGVRPAPKRGRGPGQFFSLLGFVIRDYFRSPWPLASLAILIGVHSLFFNYRSDRSHFFAIEYAMVVLIAALTTAVLFGRANRPESYAILARPVRGVTLTAALLLAAWLIALFFHIISTIIEGIRFGPLLGQGEEAVPWRDPVTYLSGSVPVMVAAAAAVGLIALMSSFVSSSGVRLSVLGVLALLVMSFDSKNFPLEIFRPFLQQLPPVLAPAAGALKFATDSPPDPIATTSLGLLALYALLLLLATLWLSSQREMVLD